MPDPTTRHSDEDEWFLRLPLAGQAEFGADALIGGAETGRMIHLVLSGVVRLSLAARDGRERVLAYLPRGSIFGEQQALAAEPRTGRTALAFADTRCLIGYIDPDELIARLQTEPDLLRHLLRVTHHKKQLLMDELERAVFRSARSQLASLLSVLARDPAEPMAIPVSQERLAQLSGRTRVTVAAQLHALAAAGAVRLERSRIVILDPALLAALAEDADADDS